MKSKILQIRVSQEAYAWLREEARKSGLSVSHVVRHSIALAEDRSQLRELQVTVERMREETRKRDLVLARVGMTAAIGAEEVATKLGIPVATIRAARDEAFGVLAKSLKEI